MDAKETIEYLYEHGHIVSFEHYKTICDALNKSITEHPDVQRLVGQVVELQAENESLQEEIEHRNAASAQALNELWKKIILKKSPGYGDWEYPMQAMRHIVCEFEELQAENDKMKQNIMDGEY